MPIHDQNLISLLNSRQINILHKTDELYSALSNLHYEGKFLEKRNIRSAGSIARCLAEELIELIAIQDKIVFPYLSQRVPSLVPLLQFLKAEHFELENKIKHLNDLCVSVEELPKRHSRKKIVRKIHDEGTYVFCLLRHHLQIEKDSVLGTIREQLKSAERQELWQKVKESPAVNN